jgi:histidinol-phosphate aminotransferase
MPALWKAKQPYNVNVAAGTAAQVSLAHAAELAAVVNRLREERERLLEGLRRIPFLEPYPSQANFILCRVRGREAAELRARLAREYGILVRYFDKPGLRDHIRITAGRPQETDALLDALEGL